MQKNTPRYLPYRKLLLPLHSLNRTILLCTAIHLIMKTNHDDEPLSAQTTSSQFNLQRFIAAQENAYPYALEEIRNGKKCSHWIWYIFLQMKGLGYSSMSEYYGIATYDEAKAYWKHPVLSARLKAIIEALLLHQGKNVKDIFGPVDALKVRSCMTLFNLIQPNDIFAEVLNQFYEGKPCERTLVMLQSNL